MPLDWQIIDTSMGAACKRLVDSGSYDQAILEALKIVEGVVRTRINSQTATAVQLILEAFGDKKKNLPEKVVIDSDPKIQDAVRSLFIGAMGIRNDKAHPPTKLRCTSIEECMRHLAFFSLLLDFLDKDKNTYPRIDKQAVLGPPEQPRILLAGRNFSTNTVFMAGAVRCEVVSVDSDNQAEIIVPRDFSGLLSATNDDKNSEPVFISTQGIASAASNIYRVIDPAVPLFSDASCTVMRPGLKGLLVHVSESGHEHRRISPTRSTYQKGQLVSHGPYEEEKVGETWYRDPTTNEIIYAWTGGTVTKPDVLGNESELELRSISILPAPIVGEPGEVRTLQIIGRRSVRDIVREENLSNKGSQWTSSDENIAYVSGTIVRLKSEGEADVRTEYAGTSLFSSATVAVRTKGSVKRAVLFQGLRRIEAVEVDADGNLYFCNQSDTVFRLNSTGGLEEVGRIPLRAIALYGIGKITLDKQRNIYATSIHEGVCFGFRWNGSEYDSPFRFTDGMAGARLALATDEDLNVFVGSTYHAQAGTILCRAPSGEEQTFQIDKTPTALAIDSKGRLLVGSNSNMSLDVYDRSTGTLIQRLYEGLPGRLVAMRIIGDDRILMLNSSEHTLRMFELGNPHDQGRLVVGDLTNGAVSFAVDNQRNVLVPDFDGNAIEKFYRAI